VVSRNAGAALAPKWEICGISYLMLGGSLIRTRYAKSFFRSKDTACRALVMGGQACVLYGPAEFSRDITSPSSRIPVIYPACARHSDDLPGRGHPCRRSIKAPAPGTRDPLPVYASGGSFACALM